ncbi:DUF485 domain-containing protein [Streptomyces sp. NPDC007905]|uniref:DUF485 domain-containing protein n=1 Tax=Streptomyces sp. NPDC007905 TaxID=3364788 RepID=UPI0036E3FCBB
MTHPDDHRYPPPGWPQPRTDPYGHAPRHESYGRDPWQEAYGHDAPRDNSYGHDVPRNNPYGQGTPRNTPYGHDAPRNSPYGHDAPRNNPYGHDTPWDDSYGQASPRPPHTHESPAHGADLADLRSAYRALRRVSTLTALGSFVAYVVLSCCAPDLMGSKIAGELSLGMALGVLQLVVTFAAVVWYGRSAQQSVDPLARAVRERTVRRDAGVAG